MVLAITPISFTGNFRTKISGDGMLAIELYDTPENIFDRLVFSDENDKMNLSLADVGGSVLVVSQFTLMASYKKGNRPSYIRAAGHAHAIPLYEYFVQTLETLLPHPVGTGEFGADMLVELVNDGPVTICMDTKNKE